MQEKKDNGVLDDFDTKGECEARVFMLWLNSLGINPRVYNLFENVKDSLVILQAFDKVLLRSVVCCCMSKPKVSPGEAAVPFSSHSEGDEKEETGVRPNQAQLSRFKAVENTNYAVDLGKQNGMHLVASKVPISWT